MDSTLEPDGLAANRETAMTELFPASGGGQPAHFPERKRAPDGEPRVKAGHRLSKNASRQQINAGDPEIGPFEIGHQNPALRQGLRMPQKADCCVISEMMERQ